MGLGKTLEMIALALAHPAPAEWVEDSTKRRPATLVVVPDALVGQWTNEVNKWAPDAKVAEWTDTRGEGAKRVARLPQGFVLTTYGAANNVANAGLEWWRVVCDEPHASLKARPRAGRIDVAPAAEACQSLDAPNRWSVTGTPFSNELFEVYGQLAFLRLLP
ncbi:SNF2 family N-terminal domain-containing protein, partial [Pelagophyceae sp. CCMP2097]